MSTPRSNIVVMKFGGTSVEDSTAILRTASIVASRLRKNLNPIVVVSAMSKVTDTLLAAAAAAGRNDREEALKLSDTLRTRHLQTAAELVMDSDKLAPEMTVTMLVALLLVRISATPVPGVIMAELVA